MNSLIEVQYFGCVASFASLMPSGQLLLEQQETFQKMSFRNRCQILGAGKVINLSVPVLGGRDQKDFTKNICIDNTQNWQIQHWRTLESCYNKSAFFLHYGPEVRQLIFAGYDKLWDLDEATLQWVLKKLKWQGGITQTSTYKKTWPEEIADNRNRFLPSNRTDFKLPPYQQVFTVPFEGNLSILDLLFNMGPQAGMYLQTV